MPLFPKEDVHSVIPWTQSDAVDCGASELSASVPFT